MEEPGVNFKKLYISLTIYFTQFAFGCVDYMISPLVIEFSEKFNTDVPSVSVVFSIHTASYLTAALISGIIFTNTNRHLCVIIVVTAASLAVYLMPHVPTIEFFYILGSIIGLAGGCCDTAQITWIIELWRKDKAAPFILGQHSMYALGILVPPLLLTPYLAQPDPPLGLTLLAPNSSNVLSLITAPAAEATELTPPNRLFIPMTIFGSLMATAAISQILLYILLQLNSKKIPSPEEQPLLLPSSLTSSKSYLLAQNPISFVFTLTKEARRRRMSVILLIIFSCLVIGFYQGMEMTSIQFFPTFSVYSGRGINLSEAQASNILFGLSLAFAAGRVLGIIVVLKIPPQFILLVNFVLILTANCVLYLEAEDSVGSMWVGSVLLGAGMSTVYPAYYAYIEKHIFITGHIVMAITVSSGIVAAIYPNIVGKYVEGNPSVLNYVIFCSLAVITLSFGVVYWTTKTVKGLKT